MSDHCAEDTERCVVRGCDEIATEGTRWGPMCELDASDLPQVDTTTEQSEASSVLFDRWIGKASDNIEKWGLQDEETLLLAITEELGELTQAHLEARDEDGDPGRIDEELDDLGALLLQLHESRNNCSLQPATDQDFSQSETSTRNKGGDSR